MSNETTDSLVWASPVGAFTRAVDLAGQRDRWNRGRETGTVDSRSTRGSHAGTGFRLPSAAAGLMLVGIVLGAALVVTVIS